MSGENRVRRRAQSTCKETSPEIYEGSNNNNKHPRVEIEALRLDDGGNNNTNNNNNNYEGGTSLEAAGRTPSFKMRMIGNYCVERTIGRGQFGKVKLAYHKKLPDMKVFLKIRKQEDRTSKKLNRRSDFVF